MPRQRTDITLTEQQTENLDFALLTDLDEDGVPEAAINLSAVDHVELWTRDSRGSAAFYTSAGGTPQLTFPANWAAAGSIRFAPGSADFVASRSPYQFQFKVFRTATVWYYVPEDSWHTIYARERIG